MSDLDALLRGAAGGVGLDRLLDGLLLAGEGAGAAGGERGYRLTRDGIDGRALLSQSRNRASALVERLKDAEGALAGEAAFWGGLLADLARESGLDEADVVTWPPGSGKRAYSLAAELAREVGRRLEVPAVETFLNPEARGHRASVAEKLRESVVYVPARRVERGERLLLVDDYLCTGRTLLRCRNALLGTGAALRVLVLGAHL